MFIKVYDYDYFQISWHLAILVTVTTVTVPVSGHVVILVADDLGTEISVSTSQEI